MKMKRIFLLFVIVTALHSRIFTLYDTRVEVRFQRKDRFCFELYGRLYNIDPDLLKAISIVETGSKSLKRKNHNGTIDYGHMQINTVNVKKFNLDTTRLIKDPCYCTEQAARILSQLFLQYGRRWETIGMYHSFTKARRVEYYQKVKKVYEDLKRKKGQTIDKGD